jgi:hypothetical protein
MTRIIKAALLTVALGAFTASNVHGESIPLKPEGGTFVVPVLINDKIPLDFTLDSGAADVSIPLDVYSTLQRAHTISKADLLEPGVYELADGSTQRQVRFRIRSLKVGSVELRDVVGSIAPPKGSLLLGQSFLSRLPSWSVDNRHHALVIGEGVAQAAKNQPTTSASYNDRAPNDRDPACGGDACPGTTDARGAAPATAPVSTSVGGSHWLNCHFDSGNQYICDKAAPAASLRPDYDEGHRSHWLSCHFEFGPVRYLCKKPGE